LVQGALQGLQHTSASERCSAELEGAAEQSGDGGGTAAEQSGDGGGSSSATTTAGTNHRPGDDLCTNNTGSAAEPPTTGLAVLPPSNKAAGATPTATAAAAAAVDVPQAAAAAIRRHQRSGSTVVPGTTGSTRHTKAVHARSASMSSMPLSVVPSSFPASPGAASVLPDHRRQGSTAEATATGSTMSSRAVVTGVGGSSAAGSVGRLSGPPVAMKSSVGSGAGVIERQYELQEFAAATRRLVLLHQKLATVEDRSAAWLSLRHCMLCCGLGAADGCST
jgi:hypothetical protein